MHAVEYITGVNYYITTSISAEEWEGWFVVKCHPAREAASYHREIETTPVEHCRHEVRVLRGEPGRDQSGANHRFARFGVKNFSFERLSQTT
jgi:hypothetical protein